VGPKLHCEAGDAITETEAHINIVAIRA